jgi:hypothetical protein
MSRRNIYYWKCDRPAAFHGTQSRGESNAELESEVREELRCHFDSKAIELSPGAGQGNHLTWNAEVDGKAMFVRVENGPENDGHLAIESMLLDRVREAGVRTPRVFGSDATRGRVSFAWQALERIAAPDLNHWFKQGTLEVPKIAFEIGVSVAKWQAITLEGFGVLDESLHGYRTTYADYFHLRLEEHLRRLGLGGLGLGGWRGTRCRDSGCYWGRFGGICRRGGHHFFFGAQALLGRQWRGAGRRRRRSPNRARRRA